MNRCVLVLSSVGIAALAGCGYVGAPLPPALNIPVRVTDLRAAQRGDKIEVEFTLPDLTTEGLPLKNLRAVEVFVGPAPNPFQESSWAASAKRFVVPNAAPGSILHRIDAAEFIGKDVAIGVRVTGPKGKLSDFSNLESLPIGRPLERPTALEAKNQETGILLTWRGSGPKYRIYRTAPGGKPERLADVDVAEFRDDSTQFESEYKYYVQAISGEKYQSDVSEPKPIVARDEFAPAVPTALTALTGVNTIDLAWNRNLEADFKGYHVYRALEDGPFTRIAELLPAAAFSDGKLESGKRYRYVVTAVDVNGNESARSQVAEAVAP